ncbi:MAG: hypothetical protein HZC02_02630 [Candidatus Levybacteria bacterium]|nr:hypothetical protein [Candidatus Levybacteria bacterium]
MIEKPYIGVTGISTKHEAYSLVESLSEQELTNPESIYQGMAGYLLSRRTVTKNLPTRPQYPGMDDLPTLLKITKDHAFNTLHYTTADMSTLYTQLTEALDALHAQGEGLVEGVQLNLAWPPVEAINRLRSDHPGLKVIFQVGPRIMDAESPDNVASRLPEYQSEIDYVLIDHSGGHGIELEPQELAEYAHAVKQTLPNAAVVFAGGLTAENVGEKIERLKDVTSDKFSIDAQRGLRTDDKQALDLEKVRRYLKEAQTHLKSK